MFCIKRDIFVDRLKGYACFLVVFGHVIIGVRLAGINIPGFFYVFERFIWSFHVALFLFLSGFVYKITGEWRGKKTKLGFIKYKLINLGIPYVIFSVVYILLNSFIAAVNTRSKVSDIFIIWKTPVAQYWFLYALFFLFCIWTVFSGMIKNWQITVFVTAIGYIASVCGTSFGSFDVAVYSALAFGLGTFADISYLKKCNTVIKMLIILCHIALWGVLFYFKIADKLFIKDIMTVFGIYASILFISIAEKIPIVADFLGFVNKYSFQAYLLHTIFTAGIRVILIHMNITSWIVHIILGTVFGILLSVFAAWIAQRISVLNICFFPTKTISRLKGEVFPRKEEI